MYPLVAYMGVEDVYPDVRSSGEEWHTVKCQDCDWKSQSNDRVKTLKCGFYHVIGQGHDLRPKDHEQIEDEFDL